MIYCFQHTNDYVSAGQGVLGKAGAGLEVGQVPSAPATAWGSVCIWGLSTALQQGLCQTKSTAPGSASPAAELSKSGILFQGRLL